MSETSNCLSYYVGEEVVCDGNVRGSGIIHIEGRFSGSINGDTLITGRESHINSTVEARVVVIAGHFEGRVTARDKVAILHCANVQGVIQAPWCDIEHGAHVRARMDIINSDEQD